MAKKSLEEKVEWITERIIKPRGKNRIMNTRKWKALNIIWMKQVPCCEKAYGIIVDYLVKENILSYSPEGNYGLVNICGQITSPLSGSKEMLYWTKRDYATQYRKIFPLVIQCSLIPKKMVKEEV